MLEDFLDKYLGEGIKQALVIELFLQALMLSGYLLAKGV
jgi:hypothetical protein